jgi:glycerophosphoryl diester phosphodiesterase
VGHGLLLLLLGFAATAAADLPARGLCAHRGAMATHPENTLVALRAAVDMGAHMIEFDVRRSADGALVVIHDRTLDRTTDGRGPVAAAALATILRLDAGSWFGAGFAGEPVPTLVQALAVLPRHLWLNVNLKGDRRLGADVARMLAADGRLDQAFIAAGAEPIAGARQAVPGILVCNLDRTDSPHRYVRETIAMGADFIQLKPRSAPHLDEFVPQLHEAGVRINYYGTDDPDTLRLLFDKGVDFPLVDDPARSLAVARQLGIPPAATPP